ncbi:MAG TPA: pro-sigmaK processing inhibitor BofA family protein [Pseudogracilibacillus sp.]|nr:pro-sigmaK processing inhibitor BofA family protein [Pseudogracilibacillus sp.]
MNMTVLFGLFLFIVVFLIVRMPRLLFRFIGTGTIRLTIGVLLLLILNGIGNQFGIFVPINIFTVLLSSILGLFGVGALIVVQLFV